jgi:septum formation protein
LIRRARGRGLARAGVVLASGSPQRRVILEQLGIDFRVEVPGTEELAEGHPQETVTENARRKARAIRTPERVLGVDTAVVLDARIYGKPRDAEEAANFLASLSGRTHEVMSGIVLREPDGTELSDVAVTRVSMRALESADLDWYLATGEWAERAGGYAIQGKGAALIQGIEGDYTNVVGLPVPALLGLAPDLIG